MLPVMLIGPSTRTDKQWRPRHSARGSGDTQSRRLPRRSPRTRRVKAGFSHHIDSTAEQFFGIHQKATQSECARPRAQGHQQIDIAVVPGIATTHRAKHTNSSDPPPVGERDQFVAVGFDDRVHRWKFSHSPDGQRALSPRRPALGTSLDGCSRSASDQSTWSSG